MSSAAPPAKTIHLASHLREVRYEIRGPLARRALQLEAAGHEIIKLNIGNPAAFGFRMPAAMRSALIQNLEAAEGYSHQKGIFAAREAVAMDAQAQGIAGVTAADVLMGNGVSELILFTMEGLLEPGDEVLVPGPDYPLWTAAVVMAGGKPVHYPCRPDAGFVPRIEDVERLITPRSRALVLINPNNPTGAVYPAEVVEALVRIAERRGLVLFSDEIYNRILYDGAIHTPAASFCRDTLCVTFGGLSKVYRASGLRTGWAICSGDKSRAKEYLDALELLASLRLCASVPGQLTVQTALGGVQSIFELTASSGRLGRQRQAVLDAVARSPYLEVVPPRGAMYAFVRVREDRVLAFDDATFAMKLLEEKHVLVVPGSSFNIANRDHFRVTFLPDAEVIAEVFVRIDALLSSWTPRP